MVKKCLLIEINKMNKRTLKVYCVELLKTNAQYFREIQRLKAQKSTTPKKAGHNSSSKKDCYNKKCPACLPCGCNQNLAEICKRVKRSPS